MKTPNRRRPNKNHGKKKSPPAASIDDLPEGVLTHILSFLPTTDAVKASAVAPPWRDLWHSVPVVDFPMRLFHSRRARERSVGHARQLFVEMLNGWLQQRPRHFPLQKFKLSFSFKNDGNIEDDVDSLLRFVIGAKVVEMDLDFCGGYFGHYRPDKLGLCEKEDSGDEMNEESDEESGDSYEFDYSGLVNSSVTLLKLRFCDLCLPGDALPYKIHSIREIYLDELRVWGEEFEHLVASCVNLEILSLKSVQFSDDWKVVSKSLKHFKFHCFNAFEVEENSVEIFAPKLESLDLYDCYDGEYFLKDTSSLVDVCVKFCDRTYRDYACWTNIVVSLGGVERLTFQNMWSWCLAYKLPRDESWAREKFEHTNEVELETFVFHNLKHLELITAFTESDIRGLELLLKKCPQLETLALVHKYPSFGNVIDTEIDAPVVLEIPRVRLVEMKDFQNTEFELFFVGLLKEYGVVLDKIVAYPQAEYDEDDKEVLGSPFVL